MILSLNSKTPIVVIAKVKLLMIHLLSSSFLVLIIHDNFIQRHYATKFSYLRAIRKLRSQLFQ